jgi:hypothetical protein
LAKLFGWCDVWRQMVFIICGGTKGRRSRIGNHGWLVSTPKNALRLLREVKRRVILK